MPIFPILQTEGLVQSGDKTRLDATQSFASGASGLSSVSIRPSADSIFYNVTEDRFLDWVYEHSGGMTDPENAVATVRASLKVVIDDTNDKIDFTFSADPDTVITATVAHAEYETYSPLFEAIVTALQAATLADYPLVTWTLALDDDTNICVLTADNLTGATGDTLSLLPESGPNASNSILPLLGFATDETQVESLALIPNPGQAFTQPFTSSTGFTFDSAVSEFTGGLVRQKDQRPAGATFAAKYTSGIDGNWGEGSLIGVANNGASVTAGRLDLSGGVLNKSVDYDGTDKIGTQQGAIRMQWTPNYDGTPATYQKFFEIAESEGSNNSRIELLHHTNGALFLLMMDSTGVNQLSNSILVFAAEAGSVNELELSWDLDAGKVYFFGSGFLVTEIDVTPFTRGPCAFLRIGGSDAATEGFIDNVVTFNTVPHTASYDAGEVLPDASYALATVALPVFSYGGVGTIQALTGFTTTEANTPHYTLNGKYWTGTVWAASNGSYAQSNPKATVLANLAAFGTSGTALTVVAVMQGANVQSSISQMDIAYTGQVFDNEVALEGEVMPANILRTATQTVRVVTAATDNLFSTDANLVKHEWNIMKFLPEGRSSYKNVHREAQSLILAWLDTHGFVDDSGNKFTVADIQNSDDLEKWATMMALRLIFESIHNAEDDVFESKARKYEGLEMFYRNRANMRIDTNGDGDVENVENLDTRSCRVVRR